MTKLVKSSRITIDKKKYILSSELFIPETEEAEDEFETVDDVETKTSLEDELRKMKEDMLEEVKVESDEKLLNAQTEFDAILKDAFDQSEKIKTDARDEGYNDGFQEGIQKGYNEASQFIDESLQIKQKYFDKYNEIKTESENDITEIIIETVETILNKHVTDDYDLIKGLVEKALVKCAFTSNLTLRVSPDDYDSAVSYKNYILSLTENIEDIDIKQDAALVPGSCIVDTDAGSVDSSVHTQFEIIKNKFTELLQSE